MRKFILSMLLAGVAASPAIAQPNDDADRQAQREERAQAREERQQARQQVREERSNNSVERQANVRPERPSGPAVQQQQQQPADRQARLQDRTDAREARRDSADTLRQQRLDQRQQAVEQRRDDRGTRQWARPATRNSPPVVSNVPRAGTQPPPPAQVRRTAAPQWSTSWRNNSRYDWHNHRRHHRSLFHLGFYFDPFGWGYNPYQIGWRLWPSYYGSRYWINDPWQYRLPYAPPGTRWVRYYDDAILVDMWSGQVVDVIYSFFW